MFRDIFHVVRKKFAAALEETAVLNADEPVLRKERDRLREINDIRFLCFISLEERPVHRVRFREDSAAELVCVKKAEIALRPVEQVDAGECILFDIIVDSLQGNLRKDHVLAACAVTFSL